jgi:apolipoprotein N-acyltransferase
MNARRVVALAAGALLACAFAPLQWWPLAVLCPAVLMWLWQDAAPREAAWLGFSFNIGTFAVGTYWLYVSLHVFGEAPLVLALFLMAALVSIMALYHAALGYVVARWLPQAGAVRWLVVVPAAWLLVEWLRGWFLSGFSWLSLGYSQTDTWLGHLAPVLGVYGITAALLVCAGALTAIVLGSLRTRIVAVVVFAAVWLAAFGLGSVEWTYPAGQPVTVAVVQGSIPEDQKWLESNRQKTLDLYQRLTETAFGARLIVWPEAAPPELANKLVPWITALYREAQAHHSALVFGVVRASDAGDKYYNSVLALDEQLTWYSKDHLVPFAEFFPVPSFVRSWLRLHNLPYADFTRGGGRQPPLPAGGLNLGATICYEDAYGSSMIRVLPSANALVNVTNDGWFAHSTARHQHFQIARLRAMEAGRYLIRAANDGISAVIGPHGEVLARAPEFTPQVLRSTVTPRMGLTPYAHVGNWLIVSLCAAALACGLWLRNYSGLRIGSAVRPGASPAETATGTPGAANRT